MRVQTVDIAQFEQVVFFKLTLRSPSFRAKVKDRAKLVQYLTMLEAEIKAKEATGETVTAPAMVAAANGGSVKASKAVSATKSTLTSPALVKLQEFMSKTKADLCGDYSKASPSMIMEGLFALPKEYAEEYDAKLTAAEAQLADEFLPAFIADYPAAIQRARLNPLLEGGLGPLWDPRDYAPVTQLPRMFSIQAQWLGLGVPEGLPAALRAKAAAKMESTLTEAADDIKAGLQESFQQLISHAVERLTVQPGEKPRIFRDSLLENIQAFLDVFSARNLMNDTQLETLVAKARAVMIPDGGQAVSADRLRTFANVREATRAGFSEIQAQLDTMITERKSRKFNLGD